MAWRPSHDEQFTEAQPNAIWLALASPFDIAVPLAALPKADLATLRTLYVTKRKGDSGDPADLRHLVPEIPGDVWLGLADIDLLDFVLHSKANRVLGLVGPRGSGKTSLINFVQAVLTEGCAGPRHEFLVVDCLEIPNQAALIELPLLVGEALRAYVQDPQRAYRGAVRAAVEQLTDVKPHRLRAAWRALADALPGGNKGLLTLVFDNLDQHHPTIISHVLEIAKELHIASGLGTIICMRPATREYILRAPSARAFMPFQIELRPPSIEAWLHNLSDRFPKQVGTLERCPVVHGVPLTPDVVRHALNRFIELLQGNRPEDDAIPLLEAVCANDMRQLIRLVRRVGASAQLPARWLLGVEERKPEFHPLTSLINGDRAFYRAISDLPNVLCMSDAAGCDEFLLLHRVLHLIETHDLPVSYGRLLTWLSELNYDPKTVLRALDILAKAILVEASDREILDNLPETSELLLTPAGRYYLDHLFSQADYLTMVVTDVPLKHRAFKKGGVVDNFGLRLRSLLEYIKVVQTEEQRQINFMIRERKPSSGLRRVADVLARGGLLTAALLDGLDDAYQRGQKSKSVEVKRLLPEIEEVLRKGRAKVESMEARLIELGNKARKWNVVAREPLVASKGLTEVRLITKPLGDEFAYSTEVRTSATSELILISLNASNAAPVAQCIVLKHAAKQPPTARTLELIGAFPERAAETVADEQVSVQLLTIPKYADPKYAERIALLSADEADNALKITWTVVEHGRPRSRRVGEVRDADQLSDWCRERLDGLGAALAADEQIDEDLRVFGVELGQRILGEEGQATLGGYYKLIDAVVVFSRRPEVPWELVCLPATADGRLPPFGRQWRMVRWPAELHDLMLRITFVDHRVRCGTLVTLGLGNDKPWRRGSPANVDEFLELTQGAGTVHVVGHWDQGRLKFSTGWCLDANLIEGYGAPRAKNVIVSSCGAAAALRHQNLPIRWALRGGAIVWSSITSITEPAARRLDDAVGEFTSENPLSHLEAMWNTDAIVPAMRAVYVRYGLSQVED
jgi:energy-coupling factor transporter ATP-binding protein EcfA2